MQRNVNSVSGALLEWQAVYANFHAARPLHLLHLAEAIWVVCVPLVAGCRSRRHGGSAIVTPQLALSNHAIRLGRVAYSWSRLGSSGVGMVWQRLTMD
jgi:hypothetical protein